MRATITIAIFAVSLAPACDGNGTATPDAGDAADVGSGVLYETCPVECPSPPRCERDQIATCCVCVDRPTRNAGRTECGLMSEYCDEPPVDPVNVTCLKPEGWPEPPPDSPTLLDVRGIVDVYGTGNPEAGGNITVEFFSMNADQTPSAAPIASAVATLAACSDGLLPPIREDGLEAECCPGPCRELKPDVDACTPTSGDCRRLWFYQVSGIPSSTPVIARTSGNPVYWKALYFYNVFFFERELEPGGGYVHYRLKALSVDDWRAIPATAGDFDGIAEGMGGVAGEIRDCDNIKVYNAEVGVDARWTTFIYFNGEEEKPYPDMSRESTNVDALYAAMEMAPGPVRVTALAQVRDEGIVNLGWWDARIFPGALTVVTIRGTRPTQVPGR
ncbi:MAG: hypothetical protein QME96_06475 [Myxococcota bacterium]|nr:hypothetical protein [Myxococcota bacterium]